MEALKGFKKLKVIQKAHKLTLEIYKVTAAFPSKEMYGLVSQLRRAMVSVPANLAEGYTRQSSKEFRQSINIAKGSLAEVEYLLLLARDLKYISPKIHDKLIESLDEVGKMLHGLFKTIDSKTRTRLTTLDSEN